jgi:hypothetical protein
MDQDEEKVELVTLEPVDLADRGDQAGQEGQADQVDRIRHQQTVLLQAVQVVSSTLQVAVEMNL